MAATKWVIFDGAGVVGRVYAQSGRPMAELMARTVFPDGTVTLKDWSHATTAERAAAKAGMFVGPQTCTRLWTNPPREP